MGEPGEASIPRPEEYGYIHFPGTPEPPPLAKPPFSLKEIRDSIPLHCFNRSLLTSTSYLAVNLLTCLSLFYAATFIGNFPVYISIFLWPAYWFFQGVHMAGLSVLAHDCGHQNFSDHHIIDHTVGFILHSLLLIPYYPWKVTHRRHHKYTASFENDENFFPVMSQTHKKLDRLTELVELIPYTSIQMAVFLLFYIPIYLLFNFKGPEQYVGPNVNVNHFSPTAAFYSPEDYNYVVLSDAGVLITLGGLISLGINYGLENVIFFYGIPYLQMTGWIQLFSYLQHVDTYIPRFRSKEWSWLRGQFGTVDRSYGKFLDFAFHYIAATHTCHHLFPSIPYYHAEEATRAITKVLGKYHLKDNTPIWKAFQRSFTNCKVAEDDVPIIFHKKN